MLSTLMLRGLASELKVHHGRHISLSRWRERERVRVDTRYIPLTLVFSPEQRGDKSMSQILANSLMLRRLGALG